MEIAPVPHRSSRGEWRRLALGFLVLIPVVLLVLLPAVLGLDRYVVTDRSMDGSLGRGSVVLAREVPAGDLDVGDVISFEVPSGSDWQGDGQRVTHRVVALDDGEITTRGDASEAVDPWRLPLDTEAYARVWVSVPWIGYPFVVDGGWVLLAVAAVVAMSLAVVAGRPHQPRTARAPGAKRDTGPSPSPSTRSRTDPATNPATNPGDEQVAKPTRPLRPRLPVS